MNKVIKFSNALVEVCLQGEDVHCIVHDFVSVSPWKGNILNCPSDHDYYGYNEISWNFFSESEEDYWKNHCVDNEINWDWFRDVVEDNLIEYILEMTEGTQ